MTKNFQTLTLAVADHIATLTLNQPDKRNALDARAMRELADAMAEVDADPSARVLVITGNGTMFCAGGDLKGFAETRPMDHLDGVRPFVDLATRMYGARVPIIARVNGTALGGGAGLVTMCDFAIATTEAEIGFPEINIGLIPATVGVALARTIGRRAAIDLLFTGRKVKAEEARLLGLINECVPGAELDARVNEKARMLAGKSPLAMRQLKSLFYAQEDMPIERALEMAVDKFAALTSSEDAQEGLRAFIEKRPPRWSGK